MIDEAPNPAPALGAPTTDEFETPQIEGLRRCPTTGGYEPPLIIQAIRPDVCMQRQREFYHKCHRCLFRGKPADFRPE